MKKIFVNSLPKSGTNLVAQCLEFMGFNQSGGIDASLVSGNKIQSVFKKLYYRPLLSKGYLIGIDMPVELSQSAINRILNQAENGEFVAGHVGYTNELLNKIKSSGFSPLLITRDPRAVLNSFVHYVISSKNHPMHDVFKDKSIAEKYRSALYGITDRKKILMPLFERCMSIDTWLNDRDVLNCRFENLIGSSGGGSKVIQERELKIIASWVGADDVNIPEIAEKVFGPGRHTFRKGAIQGWREETPDEIQQEVNQVMHDLIIKWGYEIDQH